MKKIHAIAHTHWDFEWYFTRQEAQVQFAFHMDEVFEALNNNELDYYLLDGQLSIIDDYLDTCPEKEILIKKFVAAGRLLIGPWYTQIDEMVTSGESIVRNIRIGSKLANNLGGVMKVGYLPDSFGQGQDMPKIYNGFGIDSTVFWRGFPSENDSRYFYWTSNDSSKVLVANIKNGYYAGVDLVENDNFLNLSETISTNTDADNLALPIGGDQRAIDHKLKDRLKIANEALKESDYTIQESTYPKFFSALAKESNLSSFKGEFIDPSDSKIHRGIYSSRYDLKQLYDRLERRMTYEVEPLMAIAVHQGIPEKQGLIDTIWKTIARGQAHDSSGGCNSDKTNQDILHRGIVADQLSVSLKDYLLRKLSISISNKNQLNLFAWNPLPLAINEIREFEVSTTGAIFTLSTIDGTNVPFDIIYQRQENAAVLRRNSDEMTNDFYFVTKIAFKTSVAATDWTGYLLESASSNESAHTLQTSKNIQNDFYKISFENNRLNLLTKFDNQSYSNFITFEDSGDEGDTYDYSPAFKDWLLTLDFSAADSITFKSGHFNQLMSINGSWTLPKNLEERALKTKTGKINYQLALKLSQNSNVIKFKLQIDNTIFDHRMRLVLDTHLTDIVDSFADTPFGVIARPTEDKHLKDWETIGYHEEPTSMRPMIHFANAHNKLASWSFLTLGTKDFQLIGEDFNKLAITLFRGVGFLGRPDLMRRPSDASGLQTKVVPTPDSQLNQELTFEGGLVIAAKFNPVELQKQHLQLSQNELFYQDQTINRFSTPLQYFMMNPTKSAINHNPIISIKDLKVVMSSFSLSDDKTGFELRLYNPTDEKIDQPGRFSLNTVCNVAELDLNGTLNQFIESKTDIIDILAFGPGEIRTYGIFPIK
ncbi:glycoside hydrolase family 38 N-terminal domain-containing protein [Dellaglioa sp. L3N]